MHRTQFSRSPAKALDRANDSEKAVDSFCAAGNDRVSDRLGLTSGLPRPNAGLEQFQNTSPLIDSAAALPDEHSAEPPGVSQPDAPKNFPQLAYYVESHRGISREYYLI